MWKYADGADIACIEKINVLNENLDELKQALQDALDDAVLIGCSEDDVKEAFINLIKVLHSNYSAK
ncbi:MAG: hypothetical protein HC836_40860 [Richelia sp. RM2_1_2]|nr:hypothetical protein [Richelia sp. RM2_1_2]